MAVDIGNSKVKVYLADAYDNREVECRRLGSVEEAVDTARRLVIDRVAFLTTRDLTEGEKRLVDGQGWWEFTSRTSVPIDVLYASSTLGPDRLAVAVACAEKFNDGGCLVVDLGTALTLDIVSCAGEYLGGNISPGMRMRLKALHEFTSRLPLVEGGAVDQRFGTDTRSAILSGVVYGIIGEIVTSYLDAVRLYEIENLAITGGDAEWIAKAVARKILELDGHVDSILVDEGLVGKGLIEAYLYNHE